jgi:hypothetical protein
MTESVVTRRTVGGRCYQIDRDPSRLDIPLLHQFFFATCSHWARGIPLGILRRAIAHSTVYGLYCDGAQIGFARLVTDRATFAYLSDVFIIPERPVSAGG